MELFRVCGPELKVRLRKTWEWKQAVVPILSPFFTWFNAHVLVFLKPTPQSSIKVQPCFFPPSILSFSSPLILHHVALPLHPHTTSHSALILLFHRSVSALTPVNDCCSSLPFPRPWLCVPACTCLCACVLNMCIYACHGADPVNDVISQEWLNILTGGQSLATVNVTCVGPSGLYGSLT